ncbi:MAG: hybrid sensor histidine kinase/response regulator [Nitrospirae bacterium]|nr:MAG: hybrid sensor histidine kinase/response regulator [Nitrospirota bacterium]
MDRKDEDFQKRLLDTFTVEAREHLTAISSGLIELEKARPEEQAGIVEVIFRESHSLKGAARSVNLADIVAVCQSMENVFASLKKKERVASAKMLDLLHQAVDITGRLVAGGAISADEKSTIRGVVSSLESASKGQADTEIHGQNEADGERREDPAKQGEEQKGPQDLRTSETGRGTAEILPVGRLAPSPFSAISETVRISTAKLDSLLLQAEELLSVKLTTGQRAAELREIKKLVDVRNKERTKTGTMGQGSVVNETKLMEKSPPMIPDPFIEALGSKLTDLVKTTEYDYRAVGTMVDNLLDDMKKALMLPFSSLLEMFPRFVRDISRETAKKVEFSAGGGEIEIDRRILEELKDPLIHLIRNSVDHGIETPGERLQRNKPEHGTITIAAASRENKLEITVSDNGAGVDVPRIRASAVKRGLISPEEAGRLGDRDAQLLIFRSGVTTSPIITDLSGRGLGLAIVREKVEKLNGTIAIDTHPDIGTTFTLVVPITLATFRGVHIMAGGQFFVLPSINVERVARISTGEIMTVENRETVSFNGQTLPFCRLADVLELRNTAGNKRAAGSNSGGDSLIQIIVLGSAERRVAFLVEDVLQEQEVLTKPLGLQLSRVRNVAGATVLGTGKVVPVLNVPDLLKSAVKISASPVKRASEAGRGKGKSILVVEDSITARTLLKNILESSGYDVTTAVDGVDAFTSLKTREFELVVSDVDMPRMNGFALTAKIREDRKFFELPVVLVTALESREDRERGIDAGANAYIVKSSFDQSNLLEVIRRLI